MNTEKFSLPLLVLNSVFEIERISQAPESLIVSAHLSAMSIACQHFLRVRRPGGQEGPVSLSFIDVVPSGERKTTVYRDVFQPIQKFQSEDEARVEPELEKYRFALREWNAALTELYREKSILAKSADSADSADSEDSEDSEDPSKVLEIEIERMLNSKPKRPKAFKLITQDATPEAIAQRLHEQYPSLAVVSPEGGVVLESRLFHSLGMFNSLWSSEDIEIARATKETVKIIDPSFSVTIAVQEDVIQKFLKRKGSEIHNSGFMSRFLVSKAFPKRGSRTITGETYSRGASEKFKARITAILKATHIANGPRSTYIMEFEPAAYKPWIDYFNETEMAQGPGGPLFDVAEAASKTAEQAARISALLQYIEYGPSPINVINAQRGVQIARGRMVQHKEMFGTKPEVAQDELDAASLERWLWARCQRYGGMSSFRRNEILKFGPVALRNVVRREAALIFMLREGRVRLAFRNRTAFVELNPMFFPVQNPPAWMPPSFGLYPQHRTK